MGVYLPGYGQIYGDPSDTSGSFQQANPIESKYSPRLFGAPPQLSSLCDMRIDSQYDDHEGDTGDWYRDNVLKHAQVANFFVGRALYTGGFNDIANVLRQVIAYSKALEQYDVFGTNNVQTNSSGRAQAATMSEKMIDAAKKFEAWSTEKRAEMEQTAAELENADETTETTSDSDNVTASGTGAQEFSIDSALSEDSNYSNPLVSSSDWLAQNGVSAEETFGIDDSTTMSNIGSLDGWDDIGIKGGYQAITESMNSFFGNVSMLTTPLNASLAVGQPFYTFEPDWYTYINNVKMMINSAIVMLGLQEAKVKIGDRMYPIGMNVRYNGGNDVWTNYRYITPADQENGVSTTTSIDNMRGETSQYVSFMVNTLSANENYNNQTGESKIFSTMKQGNEAGMEIAFITNSSANVIDDNIVKLAGKATGIAESVLNTLTFGAGKFVTGVTGAMARSYVGDHPIYPKIFTEHTSTTSMSMTVKLRASRGDPYTYLIDVLVPLFHILGMALPKMSQYSAGAYQFPPLIQCQIPGLWGTRLGIVSSVSVIKNPDSTAVSVNGYPLSVDVTISVEDLCHCIVTSGMDKPAYFLNNNTMFDYIAQCTGVDKYRKNTAARMVTKLALAASYGNNVFYNLGSAFANDITTFVNKHTRMGDL